jgi:hypothetical protein
MQTRNKPGRKLTPELKAVIDPIYQRDPERYKNLCRWVWWQQSRGASDESIINCVKLADAYLLSVGDWWPYLTKLMPKSSAKAFEDENNEYKKQGSESWKNLLDAFVNHKVRDESPSR